MVKITIHNWKDYIPRTDYKSMPWLRLPSRTYRVRETFGSRTSTRWLHVCLLCIAAEENAAIGVVECPLAWLEEVSGTDNLIDDLQFLEKAGLISLENLDLTFVSRTCRERVTNVSRTCDERITNVSRSLDIEREEREEREEKRQEKKKRTCQPPASPIPKRPRAAKSVVQVMDLSDTELSLGADWLNYALVNFPTKVSDAKWNPSDFALELRKVANTCGLTLDQMRDLLTFVKADVFWCNKVASPFGLLKKSSNGLRKIENALAASKSKTQIRDEQLQAQWAEDPQKKADFEYALSFIGRNRK